MHGGAIAVQQPRHLQLTQDRHDATGAVHVFHVHVRFRGRDLGQARDFPGKSVNVGHGEIDACFVGSCQEVQHRIGRSAHGDIKAHRILERLKRGDGAGKDAGIVLLVITLAQIDGEAARLAEQQLAVGMGRQHRAIAGERETQRLGQAVHRIGREHAGARTAGRACGLLDRGHFLVSVAFVGCGDHRVNEVQCVLLALDDDLASFHRAARHEDDRDIDPHRGHQHAGRDLVAVRDADDGIGAMRIDHIFDAVGDEVAAGQRIKHPVMPHGDPVIDRDGVEFLGNAARRLDLSRHQLAEVFQMHMPRHKLGEAIGDGDDGLAEIAVLHAGRTP